MKRYLCILTHQVPQNDGAFLVFEAGKEYDDNAIPAGSRDWDKEGPGDPSASLFKPVTETEEVEGNDH